MSILTPIKMDAQRLLEQGLLPGEIVDEIMRHYQVSRKYIMKVIKMLERKNNIFLAKPRNALYTTYPTERNIKNINIRNDVREVLEHETNYIFDTY